MSDWMERAKCSETDDKRERFFGTVLEQRSAIKDYCHRCPVIEQCLIYYSKMPRRERYGAGAGLTEAQLQRLTPSKLEQYRQKVASLASNDGY